MPANLHAIRQGLTTIGAGLQSMSEGVQQIIAALPSGFLLLESGDDILLEDGTSKIELE